MKQMKHLDLQQNIKKFSVLMELLKYMLILDVAEKEMVMQK